MKKSDVMVADIIIYAMKSIRMAKVDKELTGDFNYWNGEIRALTYLLFYIDNLLGGKKGQDTNLPEIIDVFNRVDEKRRNRLEILMEELWDDNYRI